MVTTQKVSGKKTEADFKTWADYCSYRQSRYAARAARMTELAAVWDSLKPGKHLLAARKAVRALQKLEAKLAKAKADLAKVQG